jgi:hypothetical protein
MIVSEQETCPMILGYPFFEIFHDLLGMLEGPNGNEIYQLQFLMEM